MSEEEKLRVCTNLSLMLDDDGRPPLPEPSLTAKSERASVGAAAQQWANFVKQEGQFSVDVSQFR